MQVWDGKYAGGSHNGNGTHGTYLVCDKYAPDFRASACHFHRAYSISTALSFAFIMLTMILCIGMAINLAVLTFLALALSSFYAALCSLAVAVISTAWLLLKWDDATIVTVFVGFMTAGASAALIPGFSLGVFICISPFLAVNVKDRNGVCICIIKGAYPLHWAVATTWSRWLMICFYTRGVLVKMMTAGGADVDQATGKRKDGATPLLLASFAGEDQIVDLLIQAGADVDKACRCGTTPMHAAAKGGHLAVVRLLLDARAEFDRPDLTGQTPLDLAKGKDVKGALQAAAAGHTVNAAAGGTLADGEGLPEATPAAACCPGSASGGGGGAPASAQSAAGDSADGTAKSDCASLDAAASKDLGASSFENLDGAERGGQSPV